MKRHTRFLMRALLLQASGKMTPAEWNELCELKAFKRENLVRDYEALALCAMRCARNQFSKETVVRLLHAVSTSTESTLLFCELIEHTTVSEQQLRHGNPNQI